MGKNGHLTFKKGHLVFGGGCIGTPRTPSDTPLSGQKQWPGGVIKKVLLKISENSLEKTFVRVPLFKNICERLLQSGGGNIVEVRNTFHYLPSGLAGL